MVRINYICKRFRDRDATTHSMTTFSIMILSIKCIFVSDTQQKGLFVTLSINVTQYQTVIMLSVAFYLFYVECHYAECRYAECHYAECSIRYIVMLNINMLSVVLLDVVMVNVLALEQQRKSQNL